jgi:predicted nucleic acid-binding protein
MILLDTNVLSELMRPVPYAPVERWLAAQPAASVFICAITEAELRYGLALLPIGKRRSSLTAVMQDMLAEDFDGRILPFDSPAGSCPREWCKSDVIIYLSGAVGRVIVRRARRTA